MLSAKEVAIEVTKALDSKKGMDIKLLRIEKVSSLADYFLICTGTSNTHVKTLCDYAEYTLENLPLRVDFIHRLEFGEVSGHQVLIKRGPGNRGPAECGTTHEATSGMSS